jgi:CRISPR-associated protein Csx17
MNIGPYDLELPGCTPEPLMAYLKALGILRLISEQKDRQARGWWRNDVFWLSSPLLFKDATSDGHKQQLLVRFFLEEYQPTPIVAPWAGGSGFFAKDNKKAVDALQQTDSSSRVARYAQVIEKVKQILKAENIRNKPTDEEKVKLLCRYRRELPDDMVYWMDTVMVLQEDGQIFAPLLGTGGNDGRLDFTQNFMQRIVSLGIHNCGALIQQAEPWLSQALFQLPAKLDAASVGQFAPGRAGGPNATQGMEADSIDNPWDFILMMEGTLMFAGAAVRRLGNIRRATSAFPFTVRTVAAGFDGLAPQEENESRGELWCPLWTRRATADELRHLFGEGRAQLSNRPAENATDFARAAASLGVDRGIAGFIRFGFLKRSGKAYLAAPIGRFAVMQRRDVDLLQEADGWLSALRLASADKNAPPRLASAVRRIDAAIFNFCKYGTPTLFQAILIALGQAERVLSTANRFREDKQIKPLFGLSHAWIEAANDETPEFKLALALACIGVCDQKIGPFRANLEPVDWKDRWKWSGDKHGVVWNAADLSANLTNVLQRRTMDALRFGNEFLPLASKCTVPLEIVAAYLEGDLDEHRIEDLLWGLILVNFENFHSPRIRKTTARLIPRTYALLKLLFLPGAIIADRQRGKVEWRLAQDEEKGILIRPEPRVIPLLRAGRVGEACRIAAQRLRVSGLVPMPGILPNGTSRDWSWSEIVTDSRQALRLCASLLLPIDSACINQLVSLVCRNQGATAIT